ncbi:protein SET DOMAIN GROUP 41 isoform X1 [Musa acuminata AAA Group]|uniref:protein SET DOMAIN GROUP 41 isoform X1 n=1 Tax=Musa acuminata AAA Group TaxID=214697 RepID=UPI0031D09E0D
MENMFRTAATSAEEEPREHPAMEMRAREETGLARDMTPPIPPLAAALHRCFLPSRCSACFRPLDSFLPCAACRGASRYCSAACSAADSSAHAASGECCLLRDHHPDGDTSDLRAALRLLHSLETLGMGILPPASLPDQPRRIAGLLASDLEKVLEEGGEVAERILEGAALMSLARGRGRSREADFDGGAASPEVVLWAVLRNSVEVHISEVGALGVAVYGPGFSWFNHSCVPNACYRFELGYRYGETGPVTPESFLASSAAAGVATDAWNAWIYGESRLACVSLLGFSKFGPRVTVRSIKPIMKGEEVCVTYVDLLQPKVERQDDLWEKYRFVCCCGRCGASSPLYMDFVLNCDARELSLDNCSNSTDPCCEEFADILDQAIADYTLDENPEACCEKLESMLFCSSQDKEFQAGGRIKLHTLHHLPLNAYITISSAYRTRLFNLLAISLDEGNNSEAFKMGRAAASYSLLLAGTVHHLFLSEPSLIATTAHFLISAAEYTCGILRIPGWSLNANQCKSDIDSVLCHYQSIMMEHSLDECKATSMRFLGCISEILSRTWPFLTEGLPYLESINSPVDFSWLGPNVINPQCFANPRGISDFINKDCSGCRHHEDIFIEDKRRFLFQLVVHCFAYGRYLASICYGPQCNLADHVEIMLHGFL